MSVDQIFSLFGQIFLYLTIALVVIFLLAFLIVSKRNKSNLPKFRKTVTVSIYVYAIIVSVIMLTLKFESIKTDDSIDFTTYNYLLWPLVATLIVLIIGGGLLLLFSYKDKSKIKLIGGIFGTLLIGCFIAIMVCMKKYFDTVAEWYPNTNLMGLIISAICFIALIIVMYFVGNKNDGLNTKSIVYGAISIALSFALSYIRFFKMPQGGSITFASILPLIIYSCMFGTRRGIIISLIYGVLQAVQDPWIIHPLQFLLDYPLAFGVIGFSGIFIEKNVFKNKKVIGFILGGILGVLLRWLCHIFSGVFAFADYADLDTYSSAWTYSMVYNASCFIDMAIALVCGSMLFASKAFVAQMEKSSDVKPHEEVVLNDDVDEIDKKIIEINENKEANEGDEIETSSIDEKPL